MVFALSQKRENSTGTYSAQLSSQGQSNYETSGEMSFHLSQPII